MRNLKLFFSKRRVAALCCIALLCSLAAVAIGEDCFTLDVDILDMDQLNSNDYVAQNLSASTQGVRVRKCVSDSSETAVSVRLTLTQMDTQTLVFDKDYGYQSKVFDSGVIYLPFVDNRAIPYLVTLYTDDMVYAMPFIQLQPRLSFNGACTFGVRLRDLENGLSSDWLMGTMLDLNALRASGFTQLELCASNAYIIGQAVVTVRNDALMVELNLDSAANVEIHGLSLYVITDCASVMSDPAYMGYPAASPGEWISLNGAESALLYMPMQVSYDPAGLPTFGYDLTGSYLQNQMNLWYSNRSSWQEPQDTPAVQEPILTPTAVPEATVPPVTEPPVTEPIVTVPVVTEPVVTEPAGITEVPTEPPMTAAPEADPAINGSMAVNGNTAVNGNAAANGSAAEQRTIPNPEQPF